MYSHVACDVMKERTLYLLKPSSLIWHLMSYLFLSNIIHPTDRPYLAVPSENFKTCLCPTLVKTSLETIAPGTVTWLVERQTRGGGGGGGGAVTYIRH